MGTSSFKLHSFPTRRSSDSEERRVGKECNPDGEDEDDVNRDVNMLFEKDFGISREDAYEQVEQASQFHDAVRSEVGNYSDKQIQSILDQLYEAGLEDKDIKVRAHGSPESQNNAVNKQVNLLQSELRPGMEAASLTKQTLRIFFME